MSWLFFRDAKKDAHVSVAKLVDTNNGLIIRPPVSLNSDQHPDLQIFTRVALKAFNLWWPCASSKHFFSDTDYGSELTHAAILSTALPAAAKLLK